MLFFLSNSSSGLFPMKLWTYHGSYWAHSSIACIFVLTLFLGLCTIVLVMVSNGFTVVACFCLIAVLLVAFLQLCISEQIGWESSIFSVCSCLYVQFMKLENREQLGDWILAAILQRAKGVRTVNSKEYHWNFLDVSYLCERNTFGHFQAIHRSFIKVYY